LTPLKGTNDGAGRVLQRLQRPQGEAASWCWAGCLGVLRWVCLGGMYMCCAGVEQVAACKVRGRTQRMMSQAISAKARAALGLMGYEHFFGWWVQGRGPEGGGTHLPPIA